MASAVVDIWVLSTGFQKSNISWPQQPPTKKVVNFNMIFHESSKSIFFQNIKIKLNSRTWMTPKSSVEIFQALEPLQPQWPPQPQQPPWPQWPLQPQQPWWSQWPHQPHFIKKNYWAWCFHQPWHQNDLLMWDGSSKTQYFIDFWHIFFWRLWRTRMLLLTKSKGHK